MASVLTLAGPPRSNAKTPARSYALDDEEQCPLAPLLQSYFRARQILTLHTLPVSAGSLCPHPQHDTLRSQSLQVANALQNWLKGIPGVVTYNSSTSRAASARWRNP